MAIVRGRNTRVEISKTLGTPVPLSALTKAKPAVATSASAHSLTVGQVGYFTGVTGMDQLEGQAAAVSVSATPSFTLGGLNTSSYSTFTAGTFTPVSVWSLLSSATAYEIPNAESDKLDGTTLLDVVKQEVAGLLAAQSVTVNGFSNPSLEAIDLINDAAIAGSLMVVRFTLEDGTRRIFTGTPSLPGESMSVGQLATNGLSFATKGRVLFLPA